MHHFFSILQEKGMGFLCLTSFFMFWVCFSWFCECVVAIMLWKISWSFKGLLYLGECSLIESQCFWLYYWCLHEVCGLCSISWLCCFIHIMFVVFCHVIFHLNPCNAQCLLDYELLLFIIIFDCLFHLLCQCCLWFLVFNLVLVSVIKWNLPVSHSYTGI